MVPISSMIAKAKSTLSVYDALIESGYVDGEIVGWISRPYGIIRQREIKDRRQKMEDR
jgi:hypothetical protein